VLLNQHWVNIYSRVKLLCLCIVIASYTKDIKSPPPCVNFINFIRARFSYERCFGSFFSSYVYVEKAAGTTFVRKMRVYKFDEIDGLLDNGQKIFIY